MEVRAGDRLYIPAGGLQCWVKENGTLDMGVSAAVDPWLPDLSDECVTPYEVLDSISRTGFPISAICNRGSIYGCQKSQDVQELISNPDAQRLKHMVVLDGQHAAGVLDLDKARGSCLHCDSESSLLVQQVFEPASRENAMLGEAPLMDYLMTADRHPFKLVQIDGAKLGTVGVEDLQKMPVRAVLLMWFSYLESVLARRLCQAAPELREIVTMTNPVEAEGLGSSGCGPVRRIEQYSFARILNEAKRNSIVSLQDDEVQLLQRYRNNVFHGPRWYITRRGEVSSLVNCVKKVVSLARELGSERGRAGCVA